MCECVAEVRQKLQPLIEASKIRLELHRERLTNAGVVRSQANQDTILVRRREPGRLGRLLKACREFDCRF